ncbi:MAG: alpha/beta hydrolase [Betaproteobacteria bacterium]|nr:alpha/beta hydrolase [Betaproteobacteria bacterium]
MRSRFDPFRWRAATLAVSVVLLLQGCGAGDSSPPEPSPLQAAIVPSSNTTTTSPADSTSRRLLEKPLAPDRVISGPGQLVSATLINTVAAADITAAVQGHDKMPSALPVYAVTSYRLTYVTQDGYGTDVVASGLVSVPVKEPGSPSPVLSYQHATIFKDAQAPSNNVVPAEPTVILASLGFIVQAADYVGFGASKAGQHPYLLSAPTAAAVTDLLTAARTWRHNASVIDNGQLFLVGYSEGGYATIAAHRALQATNSSHLRQLVSSIPGAGPYHVGVTLDMQLQRVRDENVLIAGLISPGFLRYLGSKVRNEVRRLIMRLVVPDDADVTFQSTFLDNFLADDTSAIERDSNVHDWKPEAPVRMFHGRDDQTVPYAASTRTLQAMQARGAGTTVTLTDCVATPASHLGCVAPYFSHALAQMAPWVRDL